MRTQLDKFMREPCPFRLGNKVKIAPSCEYAGDWPGTYVVVGVIWEYQKGSRHNISLASDDDIQHGNGPTDGFKVDDLLPA